MLAWGRDGEEIPVHLAAMLATGGKNPGPNGLSLRIYPIAPSSGGSTTWSEVHRPVPLRLTSVLSSISLSIRDQNVVASVVVRDVVLAVILGLYERSVWAHIII